MEDSSSTALYTGAFVMVFVSSLTISLFLFNSILDFSEKAYDYNVNIADNQTIINAPVGTERLLTSEQVASYYYNYVSHDLYEGSKPSESYDVRIFTSTSVSRSSQLNVKTNYNITKVDWTYKELMQKLGNKTYILTYDSVSSSGKPVIIIKQATIEQINSML